MNITWYVAFFVVHSVNADVGRHSAPTPAPAVFIALLVRHFYTTKGAFAILREIEIKHVNWLYAVIKTPASGPTPRASYNSMKMPVQTVIKPFILVPFRPAYIPDILTGAFLADA